MPQYIFSATQPVTIDLPDYLPIAKTFSRGNATQSITVAYISTFAELLSKTVLQSISIAEIAKKGIKGIEEWGKVLKQLPAVIGLQTSINTDLIADAEEFAKAIQNITALEKAQATAAFIEKFDIPNDKAEAIVEKVFSIALELVGVLKILK